MNYHNTGTRTQGSADAAFEAMQRHAEKLKSGTASVTPKHPPSAPAVSAGGQGSDGDGRRPGNGHPPPGDIIYGALDIADALFHLRTKKARRRIYGLAAFHRARGEQAGFFRLKGALCLSMSQWRRFHGLDQ
jgi:hypothetical protein